MPRHRARITAKLEHVGRSQHAYDDPAADCTCFTLVLEAPNPEAAAEYIRQGFRSRLETFGEGWEIVGLVVEEITADRP